jgi:hypothetical protein
VWLLFTGNDLAGRFDSVNVADRKTNWRDDFYTFRKKSPLRTSFLEIVNPKALADKGVFEKDGRLFYKPYLKEEKKRAITTNESHFFKTIDKGIAFCKTKNLQLKIVLISSKEYYLTDMQNSFYLENIYKKLNGRSGNWDLVIEPPVLRCNYGKVNMIFLDDYLISDSHLNAEGNKKVKRLIYEDLNPIDFSQFLKDIKNNN